MDGSMDGLINRLIDGLYMYLSALRACVWRFSCSCGLAVISPCGRMKEERRYTPLP